MDGFGIVTMLVGFVLYYVTGRKFPFWLFLAGVGAGILVGALWAYMLVRAL